jgi:hypothetical protein
VHSHARESVATAALSNHESIVELVPYALELGLHVLVFTVVLKSPREPFETSEELLMRCKALAAFEAPLAPEHRARPQADRGNTTATVVHKVDDDFALAHGTKLSRREPGRSAPLADGSRRRGR